MSIQTVEINTPDSFAVVEIRQGPAGEGGSGTNAITSATTSDGTANLSLANVTTATAEVTGTLTAPHIHGNLAGSLYAHVRAGENLAKGDPVYVSGSHGSGATLIAEVSKADASNAAKMPAVGIMDAAVSANATGHMVISGTITELATNAYSINAELYVAAGGGMTATPPTARAQPVARVERSNANNGAILVKVNGLSASDATGNTLVRRTSNGSASFVDINAASLTAGNIEATSLLQTAAFESTGNAAFQGSVEFQTTDYAYGTGSALAHRTALGSGATGDALFQALTPAAARTTLELGAFSPSGSITGTGELTLAAGGSNQNVTITPSGTGKIVASKKIDLNSITYTGTDAVVLVGSGMVESLPSGLCFFNNANSPFFNLAGSASTSTIFGGGISGSSFRAIRILAGGQIVLGSGSAAPDVGITRSGIGVLEINNGTAGGNGALKINATTASTSTTTGALVVSGGVGIAGAVNSLYQRVGSGSPEGVVTAPVGAVFHRTNGGAGTSFYVKESGTGNTGWVAK